ncbi:Hypothetical predicted protein [Paramuricea clavata]|uniref:Uncharacterized protein n=1 Tax=Paramuricea clavata TaxID=317549 RepID=A0A6S7FPM8_PARCT|nr:Hypothetical predicted protein [Paramuricea clavata]
MFAADLASRSVHIISIFTDNDVNTKLSMFNNNFNDDFLSTLEIHAPVKTIKVRNRPCPYVTSEIKEYWFMGNNFIANYNCHEILTIGMLIKMFVKLSKLLSRTPGTIMYVTKSVLSKIKLDLCGKL